MAYVHSLNVKNISISNNSYGLSTQFSSIWHIDRTLSSANTPGQSGHWEQWQWRSTPRFPKLQHFWNFTIRLFNVVSGNSLGVSYRSADDWAILELRFFLMVWWLYVTMHIKLLYNPLLTIFLVFLFCIGSTEEPGRSRLGLSWFN